MKRNRGIAIFLVALMVAMNLYCQFWWPESYSYGEEVTGEEVTGEEVVGDEVTEDEGTSWNMVEAASYSEESREDIGTLQQIGSTNIEASEGKAEKTLETLEESGGLVLFSAGEENAVLNRTSLDNNEDSLTPGTGAEAGNDTGAEAGSDAGAEAGDDGEGGTGENGEPVTENLTDEERPDAVIDGSSSGSSGGKVTLSDSSKVTLQYSRTIYYDSYKTHYFKAKCSDGTHVAYCVQPSVAVADRGTYAAVKGNGKALTKALYYSYGYPGFNKKMKSYLAGMKKNSCYKGNDGAYALCHMMLSYIYDGKKSSSDAFTGASSSAKSLVKKMTKKVEGWPDPPSSATLKLSPSRVKAGWNQTTRKQVTPTMKLTGTKGNTITVKIPKYTKMICKSGSKTKTISAGSSAKKTMKVSTGQSFYFTAAASKRGTYTSPSMKGSVKAFKPYFIKVKGKQDIVYGLQKQGSVSFKITWLDFGSVKLKKKSTKESFTNDNPQYSLKAARYVLLDKKGRKMGLLTTNASGEATLKNVPYGSYTLKETKASQGFALDVESYKIKVNAKTVVQEVPEKPLIPKLHTTAEDKASNSKEATATGSMTIVDKVKYSNLIPGKTYRIKGVLMDKESWEEVPGAKASRTFTPEKSSGTITVEFTFDGSKLGDSTVVAFEKLYLVDEKTGDTYEEASHEDMEDEAQSVVIKKPDRKTPPEETPKDTPKDTPQQEEKQVSMDHSPATGDEPPFMALALAVLACLIFGFTSLLRKN